MHPRTLSLVLSLALAGSVGAVIGTAAQKDRERAPLALQFVPTGNLQVGLPGELLPEAIAVRTVPGAEVRFFSPDLGIIAESGAAEATVVADAQGFARAHVRLGENLGRYTVLATPAVGDGSELVYTFRAIDAAAMQVRRAKLAQVDAGGAR